MKFPKPKSVIRLLQKIKKRKVDFVIIGAQKSGTTSLFNYLDMHPNLHGSTEKEVDYFSYDELYKRGDGWYLSKFSNQNKGTLLFEASPEYLYLPGTAERIFKYNSKIKLIAILRNPVYRSISAYNMYKKLNAGQLWRNDYLKKTKGLHAAYEEKISELLTTSNFPSFTEIVNSEIIQYKKFGFTHGFSYEPSLIFRGIYYDQLKEYLKYFNKDQLLILNFDEFIEDTASTLNRVLDFLQVDKISWSDIKFHAHLAENWKELGKSESQKLKEFYKPLNNHLFKLIGEEFRWT